MNMDQAASIALDRIGSIMRTMVSSGNGTLVVIKNTSSGAIASDGFAVIANERVRNRPAMSYSNINVTTPTNIRLGAFGYCVMNTATSATTSAPMLNWGDGTVSFLAPSAVISCMQGQAPQALMSAAADVYAKVSGNTAPTTPMLQFSPVNPGIIRFEICCLLSDGTIASGIQGSNGFPLPLISPWSGTTLLPRNRYFVTGEALNTPAVHFESPQFPLAFSPRDSDADVLDPSKPGSKGHNSNNQNVYVRAVIVGIAALDPSIQQLLKDTQIKALTGSSVLAKADGQTPLDAWDITSTTSTTASTNRANLDTSGPYKFPPAVLQNIRFYQRYYYVN